MRLHYQHPNDLSKLHDEILAAIPALRPTEDGPVMLVEGLGDDIWLTVPDGTDEPPIAAVVAAHDPTPLPPPANPWVDLRSILPYVETEEDTRDLFGVICDIMGG